MSHCATLEQLPIFKKSVLLRAGFDVPLLDGKIRDTRRIDTGLPTIEYLLSHGATRVACIFHLGRPGGKVDPALSTHPVARYIGDHVSDPSKVTVYENLRFDPREETNNVDYAKELTRGYDIFVQDAFNTLHEPHTSIIGIPRILPSAIGLVVQKELDVLMALKDTARHPYCVIIGGAKIEEKLPVIDHFVTVADHILVGGAIAVSAREQGLYADNQNVVIACDGITGPHGKDADIGPKTIAQFSGYLTKAQTIFWNGSLGMTEHTEYAQGSKAIAQIMAISHATTVIGGGDTTGFIDGLGIADKISYISTGGGASLKFLVGETLPGLEVLHG